MKIIGKISNKLVFLFLAFFLLFTIFKPQTQVGEHNWSSYLITFPLIIVLIWGLVLVAKLLRQVSNKAVMIKLCLWVLLLIFESFLAVKIQGFGTTDPFAVWNQAESLAHSDFSWYPYFQLFSNNVPIVIILFLLIKIATFLAVPHVLFVNAVLFVLLDCAVWAISQMLTKKMGLIESELFLILNILFAPIYLTALNYYTDSVSLIFIVLGYYFYTQVEDHLNFNWAIIYTSFFVSLAILIKPNMIFLALGWLIVLLFSHWQSGLQLLLAIAAIFLVISFLFTFSGQKLGYQKNKAQQYPLSGFVYMGYNQSLGGAYSVKDYLRPIQEQSKKSQGIPDYLRDRVQSEGAKGLVTTWVKKVKNLGSTGDMNTLMWPSNFVEVPNGFIKHHRSILFTAENFFRVVYAAIILLAIFGLSSSSSKAGRLNFQAVGLGILLLWLFHIFAWEVEPRYMLASMPFVIIFAVQGLIRLAQSNRFSPMIQHPILTSVVVSCFALIGFIIVNQNASTQLQNTSNNVINQNITSYFESPHLNTSNLLLRGKTTLNQPFQAIDNIQQVVVYNVPIKNISKLEFRLLNHLGQTITGQKDIQIVKSDPKFNPGMTSVVIKTNANPGHYRLQISNKTATDVKIAGVSSPYLKLKFLQPVLERKSTYLAFYVQNIKYQRVVSFQSLLLLTLIPLMLLWLLVPLFVMLSR